MNSDTERKRSVLVSAAYFLLIVGIYYVVFRYAIYALMPFVIAGVVTLFLRRPIDFISKSVHVNRKGVAVIMVLLFYATLGFAAVMIVIQIVYSLSDVFGRLPALYSVYVAPYISQGLGFYEEQVAKVNPELLSSVRNLSSTLTAKLYEIISAISKSLLSFAQGFVVGAPATFIGIVFCVISTVFLSADTPNIRHFLLSQFNERGQAIIHGSMECLRGSVGKVILSYMLIMFITFTELNIGLRIIRVENPTLVAALIAMFDILPALGTGGIMAPWAVIEVVKGNYKLALGIAIVYAVVTVVRNYIEPKLVGTTLGLHPVIMLMSIFLGAGLLGPLGIIILPFTLIVVKSLNDRGLIHLFNSEYNKAEPDTRIYRREKNENSAGNGWTEIAPDKPQKETKYKEISEKKEERHE